MQAKHLFIVRVGSDDRPATDEDVKEMETLVEKLVETQDLPLIPVVLKNPVEAILFPPLNEKGLQLLQVRVGNDAQLTTAEINQAVGEKIQKVIDKHCLPITMMVTHHVVEIDLFPPMRSPLSNSDPDLGGEKF